MSETVKTEEQSATNAATPATAEGSPLPEARGFRSFRNTLDVENFYRFIHENDMRREAKIMLEFIQSKLVTTKKKRRSSKENLQ